MKHIERQILIGLPALAAAFLLPLGHYAQGSEVAPVQDPKARAEPLQEEQESTPELASQNPVKGVRGILVRSRLVRSEAREEPLEICFTHVFPDRSRIEVRPVGGTSRDARRVLRAGTRLWSLDGNMPGSQLLAGEDRKRSSLSLELRRGLFLFPLGLDWKHSDGGRSASAELRLAPGDADVLGTLTTSLDEAGRVARMAALWPDGSEHEALTVESWSQDGIPETLTIETEGSLHGRETVSRATTDLRYHDTFFIPPDQREVTGGTGGLRLWRTMDLQAITYRRIPLSEGATWAQARETQELQMAAAAEALQSTPHRLDPRPCIELDWKGAPRAVLLRLARHTTDAPEGWTSLDDRPGVALVLQKLEHLDTTRLATLRRGIPKDAAAGEPYALLFDEGRFEAQVFASFTPR